MLDKAETLARRVLERLGSKVDDKLASQSETLSARVIGDLVSRIEQVVDSSLKEDEHGIRRLAPNRFKVLFTYEETSELTPQYIEAVGKELTASAFEFINNRRYVTRGPIEVQAGRDLFAKATAVKASFDDEPQRADTESHTSPVSHTEDSKVICLTSSDGRSYRVELKAEGAPAHLGRAAESAVRIDDPSISRLHCSLALRSDGNIVIGDLGSANGTYLNQQLLARDEARALKSGDIIRAGDLEFAVSDVF